MHKVGLDGADDLPQPTDQGEFAAELAGATAQRNVMNDEALLLHHSHGLVLDRDGDMHVETGIARCAGDG